MIIKELIDGFEGESQLHLYQLMQDPMMQRLLTEALAVINNRMANLQLPETEEHVELLKFSRAYRDYRTQRNLIEDFFQFNTQYARKLSGEEK